MILVLSGPPGAGKGTQGDLLAARSGYRKISTGDALRSQVKQRTAIGQKAESIMAQGKLVPDDVLFEILKTELGSDRTEKILLDGYPRNVAQAETLDSLKNIHPVAAVVHLDVNRDDLVKRLSGRRVCSQCGATYHLQSMNTRAPGICDNCGGAVTQRPDDHPDKIAVRLDVYGSSTEPVFEFYRKRSLYSKLDGGGSTEEVFARLRLAVEMKMS